MKRLMLTVGCAFSMFGCAHLKVTKIDPVARANDEDRHVKGFRYYLSRPYILVKDKLVISSETSILVFSAEDLNKEKLEGFLAQDVKPVGEVKSTAGTLDMVSAQAWDAMRSQLLQSGSTIALTRSAALDANRRQMSAADQPMAVSVPAAADASAKTGATTDNETAKSTGTSSPGGSKLGEQLPPTDDGTKTVNLKGAIDVVFLPDFDEQYAVHDQKVFSKSSYGMTFRDGWQLVGVNGDFDSTPVALALLDAIDTAIDTAKTVTMAKLDTAAKVASAQKSAKDLVSSAKDKDGNVTKYLLLEVRREKVLKPGLYRVNKPWEISEATPATGHGLLEKMGLPQTEVVSVIRAEITDTAEPPK